MGTMNIVDVEHAIEFDELECLPSEALEMVPFGVMVSFAVTYRSQNALKIIWRSRSASNSHDLKTVRRNSPEIAVMSDIDVNCGDAIGSTEAVAVIAYHSIRGRKPNGDLCRSLKLCHSRVVPLRILRAFTLCATRTTNACSAALFELYKWYPFAAIDTETIHSAIRRTGDITLMKFAETTAPCEHVLSYEEHDDLFCVYATARRIVRFDAVGLPKYRLAITLLENLYHLRFCVYIAAQRTLGDQLALVVADLVHLCTLFGL